MLENLEKLKSLGYIKEDNIYELVEKACIYHDIGKINEEFQNRVTGKSKKFNESKEVVHNILSLYFIDSKNIKSIDDYLKVAHSVLNHHNYCDNFDEMSKKEDIIKKLLDNYKVFNLKKSTSSKLKSIVENSDSIKIKGYLHKCDYSASSGDEIEFK